MAALKFASYQINGVQTEDDNTDDNTSVFQNQAVNTAKQRCLKRLKNLAAFFACHLESLSRSLWAKYYYLASYKKT